jgi:hypothetical protein
LPQGSRSRECWSFLKPSVKFSSLIIYQRWMLEKKNFASDLNFYSKQS